MLWMSMVRCALILGAVMTLASCGSSGFDSDGGEDALTMQFLEFNDEDIEQQDIVVATAAQVDVCPTICEFGEGGIFGDEEYEEFTETFANAVFQNNGTADILLDTITVSTPQSGIPPRTTSVAVLIPSGRCSNSPTTRCGLDNQCGVLGTCEQSQTPVGLQLYDFIFKELIRGDAICPSVDPITGLPTQGTVVPQTFQTNVTFSGSDASGERFTVKSGLVASFFDANNCSDQGSGGE